MTEQEQNVTQEYLDKLREYITLLEINMGNPVRVAILKSQVFDQDQSN
jgi:hypothetical protein